MPFSFRRDVNSYFWDHFTSVQYIRRLDSSPTWMPTDSWSRATWGFPTPGREVKTWSRGLSWEVRGPCLWFAASLCSSWRKLPSKHRWTLTSPLLLSGFCSGPQFSPESRSCWSAEPFRPWQAHSRCGGHCQRELKQAKLKYDRFFVKLRNSQIRSSSQTFSKHLSSVSTNTWMRSSIPSSDSLESTQNTKKSVA